MSGNFGENGNSLWLLSFYTPSCGMRMPGVCAMNAPYAFILNNQKLHYFDEKMSKKLLQI